MVGALALLPATLNGRFVGAAADVAISGTGCAAVSGSADLFYQVRVPPNQVAHFSLRAAGADVIANVSTGCSFNACFASAATRGIDTTVFSIVNQSANQQVAVLALSARNQRTSNATFVLTTTNGPITQDSCQSTLAPVSSSATIELQLSSATANHQFMYSGRCSPTGGQDTVVPLLMPPRSHARIVTRSADDVVLNIVEGGGACPPADPGACVASADRRGAGGLEEVIVENLTNVARRLQLVISARRPVTTSSTTTATVTVSHDVLAGDTCGVPDAMPLLANGVATYSLAGMRNHASFTDNGSCRASVGGADRVHRIVAGAGQQVDVGLRPMNFTGVLNVRPVEFDGCGTDAYCEPGVQSAPGVRNEGALYHFTDEPREFFAFVSDTSAATSSGTYQLDVKFSGEACEDFHGFTIGEDTRLLSETFAGNANSYLLGGASCATPAGGADRVFRLTLPPDAGFTATVNSPVPVTVNVVLGAASGCAAGLCAQGATSTQLADGGRQAVLDFTPPAAGQAFLIVSARSAPTSNAPYSLAVVFDAGVAGDSCGKAELLTFPSVRSNETLVGMTRNYNLQANVGCAVSTGAERVYSFEVPPLRSASIEVTSTDDVVLNLVTQPAWNCGAFCYAGINFSTSGTEVAALTNRSSIPERYYLIVSRATPGPMTFSVNATLQ